MEVPPSCSKIITIQAKSIPDGDYIFRPRFHDLNGLVFSTAIVRVKDKSAAYSVLNTNKYTTFLPKLRSLGSFRAYHPDDLRLEYSSDPTPLDFELIDNPSSPQPSPVPAPPTEKKPSPHPHIISEEMWKQFQFGPTLTPDQVEKFKTLIQKYREAFSFGLEELGRINCITASINTGDAPPVYKSQWRMSQKERDELSKQTKANVEIGVVERSTSPYNAPVFSIPKANTDERRFVQDYRELNKTVELFTFPIPRIQDVLQRLAGSKYFVTVDSMQSFWQLPLDPESRPKTAYSIPGLGKYQLTVCPYGYLNSPALYSDALMRIFAEYNNQICVLYIDDTCIFSKSFPGIIRNTELILARAKEVGLTYKPSKCRFGFETIPLLGHIVTGKSYQIDPIHIDPVQKAAPPRTINLLQRFLWLANYFHENVERFAHTAKPLYDALSPKKMGTT